MSTPQRFAAVDTAVLLLLGAGDEQCLEAIDALNKAGFFFVVTETVLQEIADIIACDSDPDVKASAKNTLVSITNYGFITPALTAVQMGVSEQVAKSLQEQYWPNGELNDGLILAEGAYHGCRICLTKRESLLNSNRETLRLALVNSDLSSVVVASPSEIVTFFRSINP